MRVKKLISFYENQHYFTVLFVHNFLSRWLNESFRFFCISYIKILKNWFILQNPSFYSFLWLIGLPVFWRWHHLLLSFWWNWDRFAWCLLHLSFGCNLCDDDRYTWYILTKPSLLRKEGCNRPTRYCLCPTCPSPAGGSLPYTQALNPYHRD